VTVTLSIAMSEFVPRLYDYEASGNCLKVRATMRLLDRRFVRVPVDIFAGDTLGDDYRRVNPLRTVPVLEIAPDRFLPESNAILLHVADGSPLVPADAADRADVHRWLFFERAFTPTVGGLRFLRLTGRDDNEWEVAEALTTGRRLLAHLDEALRERSFLAGDSLTVADISLYAYAHVAGDAGFDLAPLRALREWLDRVAGTPGFVDDLVPYPENARPGRSRSIYD
jgi:glutathione S-transferase